VSDALASGTLPPMSVVERAHRHLRRTLVGHFRFEGLDEPMKVVVAPDGHLVAPVMVAMLQAFDTVLFLPDDNEDSLQLQVSLEELKEHGPAGHLCDRWQAYHGAPPDVRWALLSIDAAKFEGLFVDGSALVRANPLAGEEARLCREFNGAASGDGAALLQQACNAALPERLENPVLVGVDEWGFDVRGTFRVHRIEAPQLLLCAEDARRALRGIGTSPGR